MRANSQAPGSSADLDAFVALGQRDRSAPQPAESAAVYRKMIALRPDLAEPHNRLGDLLLNQGRIDEAAAHYLQAIALKPGIYHAHNNLGCILRLQGKFDEARAQFEHVIALVPDLAEAYNNLGNVLKDQGKIDQAAVQYERAAALNPRLFQPHHHLGSIFHVQGKLDQAVARFEQAIALKPDLAEAHQNLANVLKEQGELDKARARFEQAIALRPDYAEAHYQRADLKTFRAGDPDLAELESLAADTSRLPPNKLLYFHFALGKALEDVGDYRRAFGHLLRGNALKRREVHYHEVSCQREFQAIAEQFDGSLPDRIGAVGDPSAAPIFVLGMPRSGSTLVEQILASHPLVHAAGELTILERLVRMLPDADGRAVPYPQGIAGLDADGFRRLGQAYLAGLPHLPAGKTRITDKAPANFFHVGLIRLILPNARIIHTVRDPVDTCVSCFSRLYSFGSSFSYDLAELGCYYRWYYELMDHWRTVLPAGSMLDVAYEDVVDDLEQQARRLIDYCGLPWDDRCLKFHETNRPIATASNVQVRRPLYRSSVARWRRYEAQLEPLLAELAPCRQSCRG